MHLVHNVLFVTYIIELVVYLCLIDEWSVISLDGRHSVVKCIGYQKRHM